MKGFIVVSFFLYAFILTLAPDVVNGAIMDANAKELIEMANKKGPYVGVIVPSLSQMNRLLQYPEFKSNNLTIDYAGRRFRFGSIDKKVVVVVMSGTGMINTAATTQMLLSVFLVEGVVHYGVAGNADPSLNIGDVTIPQYWSHGSVWSWQRYGEGPEDELPYGTTEIGYLKFSEFDTNSIGGRPSDNLLNNVWYQPEEVLPVHGNPEEVQSAFWVPVNTYYFQISQTLEGIELEDCIHTNRSGCFHHNCINTTHCLKEKPKVTTVRRGISGSIYVDNAAYRSFIQKKFKVSPVDMESGAVALVCYQQNVPFIAIKGLSNLAGSGNEANSLSTVDANSYSGLAGYNAAKVVVEFIKRLGIIFKGKSSFPLMMNKNM